MTPPTPAASAVLDLNFTGEDTIAGLIIDGTPYGPGTYDMDHPSGAFTGTGPSIITKEIAGTTRVLVDSDGDGSANMRIDLLDTLGVTATDFIL